jgi:SAM-dependent methyltransferase
MLAPFGRGARFRLASCRGAYVPGKAWTGRGARRLAPDFRPRESRRGMQTRISAERQYAEFYSLWVEDFRKDTTLYLDLAAKYAGQVLEIGCGTGRVLARFGEAGYEALGVDVSRPMLEVARRTLAPWQDRIRIADFDFRGNALFEKFHVVLASLYTFNYLIDVAEQRLFLRHVSRCMKSPAVLAIDFFCPLPMMRPETNGKVREMERTVRGHQLRLRDKREMLTPLLERRTQEFSVDGSPFVEHVSHRRFLPAQQAEQLLVEAGFENVRYLRDYDLSTACAIGEGERPLGPYQLVAEL